jgi:RHS repeat-associated protein
VRDGLPPSPGAPAVDPALGLAAVTFPIEVPPGRHGLQPFIALQYSSASGPGNAGYGFGLDVGSIQRSTRHGPPRFDDTDVFTLTLDGTAHDLMPVDASGQRFRTVLDSGFLVERLPGGPYGAGSTYWVARGRDGRFYRFGFNGDAASGDVSQVPNFKWGLDRVEDASGNRMELRYAAHGALLYPTRIAYASHPATGLEPTNHVQICWEGRGDQPATPSGERLLYRLAGILTLASGRAARSFTFRYDTAGDGSDALGVCAPISGTPPEGEPDDPDPAPGGDRPARRRRSPGEDPRGGDAEATAWSSSATSLSPGDSRLMAVFRGDGEGGALPAIEYGYEAPTALAWPPGAPGGPLPLPFVYTSDDVDEDPGVRLEDLNRDGLPDLVHFAAHVVSGTYDVTRAVYLNTGAGFVFDAAWTDSLLNLIDAADQSRSAYFVLKRGTRDRVETGVRFLDVNDDGYPDVVRLALHYGLGLRKAVFLNTGTGFTANVIASHPLPDEPFVNVHADPSRDVSDDLGVRIADVNGDGRADLLVSRAEWNGPVERRVYLYDRGAYRLHSGWLLPEEPFVRHISHGRWLDMGVRLLELNRDGRLDLFVAANVDGVVRQSAYLNSGVPGGPGPTWVRSEANWWLDVYGERFVDVTSAGDGASFDRGLRVADLNGDGYSDIVLARSWDGAAAEKKLYGTGPAGGWHLRHLPEFPWLFVVKSPGEAPRDQGVRLADLDGDGGIDALYAPQSGAREWRRNASWLLRPRIASYSNGLGGVTRLVYAPAPHGGQAEGGLRAALPFPLAVVASLAVSDGLGNDYTTRYAYAGGFYHHRGRDFRGFRDVTVLEPGGIQAARLRSFQQPGLAIAPLKGQTEERVVMRAADGAVFSRTVRAHDTTDALSPLLHPLVREETCLLDWTTVDPSGPCVRLTAVSYEYLFDETRLPDRPLARRVERREGDVGDPLDDRLILDEFLWALDAGAAAGPASGRWFLDLPFHRSVAGADGIVVEESWTYYDDRPLGETGTRGLATGEEARGGPPGPPGEHGPGDPGNPVTRRAYDPYGNLAAEIDPLGRRRSFARDPADAARAFPAVETDPLGRVTVRRFDARTGLLEEVVDPNGRSVRIEYDGFGRRMAEYGPYDPPDRPTVAYQHAYSAVPARVVRYAREQVGAGEKAGTQGCIESIAFFDGLGRLIETKTESPGGTMLVGGAVAFDPAGRVRSLAEPFRVPAGPDYVPPGAAPFASVMEYDAAGRRTAVINARGEALREERSGFTSTLTDPLGHRRDVHRDAFGGVVRVVDFEGDPATWRPASVSTYAYDAAGRMVRATDPSGVLTILAYDALGRRTSLQDPHTGTWHYAYDLKGNLVAETDPEGRVTTVSHDDLDRPVERILPDGDRHSWRYDEGGAAADAIGRLTSIVDPTGSQRFAHDALGRVVRTERLLDGALFTIRTEYDAQGRVASLELPGAEAARYVYDEGGNLAAVLPFATAMTYDERGQPAGMALANGVSVRRSYDPRTGRLERITGLGPDGAPLLDLAYDHLPDGQVAAVTDATLPAEPRAERFAYDGRHRLTRASGPYGDLEYLHDDAGNLLMKEGLGLFYDDPARPHRLTRTAAGTSFSYDAAGNVTAIRSGSGDRLMTYDASGRLARLTDAAAGVTVTHAYDASGHRVREVTERDGTRSVLLTPAPQIEVRDGAPTLHYFAAGLRIATVGPDGRARYPVVDHLGSTRLVADDAGKAVGRYDYRPYGEVRPGQDGAPATTHLFAGARLNEATGLMLMGSRHYDPSLGRFLQPDALVADRFDPLALNRYAYARCNPVNLVDPDGRSPLGLLLLAGAFALLDRETRAEVAGSVAITAASIVLTAALGPGGGFAWKALVASRAALLAAAATTVILSTPLGEGIVESYTLLFQELGLSPRNAGVAGRAFTTFLLNSHLQRSIAGAAAPRGGLHAGEPIGGRSDLDGWLAAQGSALDRIGAPTGDAYGTTVQDRAGAGGRPRELQRFYALRDESGTIVGVYGVRDIGPFLDHGAVGFFGRTPAVSRPHFAYGLGGLSTQQFARDLFAAGYGGSLFTLTGRASDFLIEFVYGPYGGGLALGYQQARSAAGARGDPP